MSTRTNNQQSQIKTTDKSETIAQKLIKSIKYQISILKMNCCQADSFYSDKNKQSLELINKWP